MTFDSEEALRSKVRGWLAKEGYPLEFRVANLSGAAGFKVEQGAYVRPEAAKPREIDVLASKSVILDHLEQHILLRCYNVIECKWSQDKPWVIFTSSTSRMIASACIAQTIASQAGMATVWSNAGHRDLQDLSLFDCRERSGFGGRQVFSEKQDYFYNAISSVSLSAQLIADGYNRYKMHTYLAALCFPVIVVDGYLYEAWIDESNEMQTSRRDTIRCLWRGSEGRELRVPVDIVAADHFETFIKQRASDLAVLIPIAVDTLKELVACEREKSLTPLSVKQGPTGMIGRPPFIARILKPNN